MPRRSEDREQDNRDRGRAADQNAKTKPSSRKGKIAA